MNVPVWVGWLFTIIMAIISIVLLVGKGSFLIAGYNTSSKEEKERYNIKKLCRVAGGGLATITIMLGISVYYNFEFPYAMLDLMFPWGVFIVLVVMIILSNTICKKVKNIK